MSRENFLKFFNTATKEGRSFLFENEAGQVCKSYGVPVAESILAKSSSEAVKAAESLGFPVVLKVVSKDVIHKSDVGGVILNLSTPEQFRNGFEKMLANVRARKPDAQISGVLVTRMMSPGFEVILGMTRDSSFGPVLMFGIGGIFVEVYKDVSFRVAPLSKRDAYEMLDEIRGASLLDGYRGSEPLDKDAIVDIIRKLSGIAEENSEILSLDLNPVLVYPKGAVAVDMRFAI